MINIVEERIMYIRVVVLSQDVVQRYREMENMRELRKYKDRMKEDILYI